MILKQAGSVVQNMSAVVVYLPEVNKVTHLEVAEYTIEQFLSDVGGAAGLVLGVSLATLVGFLDCCLVSFFRFFHLRKDLVIYCFFTFSH